jgi:N-methylhydantoinase B/oxoprolinase/acetone carboxylase alpha subunit
MKDAFSTSLGQSKKDKLQEVSNVEEFGEEDVPLSYVKQIISETKEKNQLTLDKVERQRDNKTKKITDNQAKKRKIDIEMRKDVEEVARLNKKARLLNIQIDLKQSLTTEI